jgi:internalin A
LDDFDTHFKPFIRDGSIKSWSDREIEPGLEWFKAINLARTAAKIAILLVTPDFIASDFIHEYELGPLLKEAKEGGFESFGYPFKLAPTKKRLSRITKPLFLILRNHRPA